jgi:hypothetical protein
MQFLFLQVVFLLTICLKGLECYSVPSPKCIRLSVIIYISSVVSYGTRFLRNGGFKQTASCRPVARYKFQMAYFFVYFSTAQTSSPLLLPYLTQIHNSMIKCTFAHVSVMVSSADYHVITSSSTQHFHCLKLCIYYY